MHPHERGRAAERLAGEFLAGHGLEPLGGNWRRRLGEIDLVMREPASGTIVFVEVRYRTHAALGGGLASVDRRKRVRLRRAALAWLQAHADPDTSARIDVVAVGPAPSTWTDGDGVPSVGPTERVVARRGAQLVEWIVNAVEGED